MPNNLVMFHNKMQVLINVKDHPDRVLRKTSMHPTTPVIVEDVFLEELFERNSQMSYPFSNQADGNASRTTLGIPSQTIKHTGGILSPSVSLSLLRR